MGFRLENVCGIIVQNNPINFVDPWGLFHAVFNAGAHIWLPPTAGAAGVNFSSEWRGFSISDSEYKGMKKEISIGLLLDIGVSAGIAGFSSCQNGKETSLSFTHPFLGRYGGIQILYKGGEFDGVAFGLGKGLSLPITYTMELEEFLGRLRGAKK